LRRFLYSNKTYIIKTYFVQIKTGDSMAHKKIILAALAHPDDESFGMGGTLALYAGQGHDVYLICATRGEAGTVAPQHLTGFDSIAELRESELRCAAQQLGLKKSFFSIIAIRACRAWQPTSTPMPKSTRPSPKSLPKWFITCVT
jgi:hypothetical protein